MPRKRLTPDEQRRLDILESRPAPGNPSLTIREEKQRCLVLRQEFATRYGVHPYSQSRENFYRLMISGGVVPDCPRYDLGPYRSKFAHWCQSSPLFDHQELWGCDRKPKILVGHPYDDIRIRGENRWILDEFRSRGLDVQENGPEASFYGFGTVQFLVFAHGFLASPEPAPADSGETALR